jgi:hypothetical protein
MIKLKVLNCPDYNPFSPLLLSGFDVLVPFCEDVFEFTADIHDADILPMMDLQCTNLNEIFSSLSQINLSNKLFVNISPLMHVAENHTLDFIKLHHTNLKIQDFIKTLPDHNQPNVVTLHTNLNHVNEPAHPDILYTDIMWNRQVTLFATMPDAIFNSDNTQKRNHWYPSSDPETGILSKKVYELYDLDYACSESFFKNMNSNHILLKKFISTNNTRATHLHRKYYSGFLSESENKASQDTGLALRDFLRTELVEKLQRYPGFIGDCAAHNFLVGQHMNEPDMEYAIAGSRYVMYPLHNTYYKASVLSVYVESLVNPELSDTGHVVSRTITEKTWDPLIKGSFILPFGYPGMIQELKQVYGFQFPEWIDYRYDSHTNDLERWKLYLDSVHTLLNLPAETLFQYKIRDKEILKYNRSLFFKKKYRIPVSEALTNWIIQRMDLSDIDLHKHMRSVLG